MSKVKNEFKESITDLQLSFRLLRDNWRPFLKTEIFALGAFTVSFMILGFLVFFLQSPLLGRNTPSHPPYPLQKPRIPLMFLLLGLFVFYAFISSQFGLAHDIILSGDMFTEFESSFRYFKKYFFKYLFLSLLILWLPLVLIFEFSIKHFLEFSTFNLINFGKYQYNSLIDLFFVYLIQFTFFVIFSTTLPSITTHGDLKKSFTENFNILVHHPKRLFTSWGLFFVIFSLPAFAIVIISLFVIRTVLPSLFLVLGIFFIFLVLSSVILGYPLMSLIATRIYTTTVDEAEK